MKNYKEILKNEETLDNPDFETMRQLGKKMVDDAVDYLQGIHQQPAWKEIPQSSKEFLQKKLPRQGANLEDIYQEFTQHIFPYHGGNIHPRYFSWVQGNGTLSGAFADMLASTMNANVAIGEQSAMYVDAQVINWAKEIMGFGADASGILLSGGSIANVSALIIARNSIANKQIKKVGLQNIAEKLRLYCSDQTHNSVQKAAEAIGLGEASLGKISVNDDFEMDVAELEKAIIHDKKNGYLPFCVVANCGSVNTGSIDDIEAIHALCQKYDLWLHVDGAFGAVAKITDEFKDTLKVIEKADSLAFDFHKWFYVNYEVACLLVKDVKKHRDAFAVAASYLSSHERGLMSGPDSISNYGLELSRGFKALKVWMSLKEHGIEKYKRLVRQNIAQTYYLAELIESESELELMHKPTLNIVCYRFKSHNNLDLNKLNKELLMTLQEQGIATPSSTILNGNYVIRVCNVNHRTKKEDLEVMVKESVRIGREIIAR